MAPKQKANREVVERLCQHLILAFETFADKEANNTPEGLTYLDAFMGAHNFHKAIILDLARRNPEHGPMLRQSAVDTLAQALRQFPDGN